MRVNLRTDVPLQVHLAVVHMEVQGRVPSLQGENALLIILRQHIKPPHLSQNMLIRSISL